MNIGIWEVYDLSIFVGLKNAAMNFRNFLSNRALLSINNFFIKKNVHYSNFLPEFVD